MKRIALISALLLTCLGSAFADVIVWETQIRSGNGNPNGDFEQAIGSNDPNWSSQAQFQWVNGQAVQFRVRQIGNSIVFNLGSATGNQLTYTPSGAINGLRIWFQAKLLNSPSPNATASVSVFDLVQNGVQLPIMVTSQSTPTTAGAMSSQIVPVTGSLDLTGQVRFSWANTSIPSGSRLDVHFVGMALDQALDTPEPSTLVFSAIGLLMLIAGSPRSRVALARLRIRR